MKKVVIEISDDLTVKVDYNGFQGDACLKDYEELLKILENMGIKAENIETTKKREFYVRNSLKIQQR